MKVTTFGEGLFRFVTHKGERLSHAQDLKFYLGGTELNIAANLTTLGIECDWVSCLPTGMTGDLIRERIKNLHVNATYCADIEGGQVGWYLMEMGATPRPDMVFHRYAGSIASLTSFPFDWKSILKSSNLFHTSGITAGLSRALTSEVQKAMKAAKELGLTVSYDFNYRKNIWSIEDFIKYQKDLLQFVDILFCSEKDLELFFEKDPKSRDYQKVFSKTSATVLVMSCRSVDETEYSIKVVTPKGECTSQVYQIQSIDRIGVGDSMAAGFMKSYLEDKDEKKAAEWAAIAGAMKYGISGDMALIHPKEIESILQNGTKGIIR